VPAELRLFAEQQSLAFREDASNASLDFLRNRIRHELLPLLVKQYQPALRRTTLRLMDILSAEAEFITRTAEACSGKNAAPLRTPAAAIQRRCCIAPVQTGLDVDFDLVERLRAAADQPVAVSPQTSVCRDAAVKSDCGPPRRSHLTPGGLLSDLTRKSGMVVSAVENLLGDPGILARACSRRGSGLLERNISTRAKSAHRSCSVIGGGGIVSAHRHDEQCQIAGSLLQPKVPRAERHWRVIAATTRAELVWVQGLRIVRNFSSWTRAQPFPD